MWSGREGWVPVATRIFLAVISWLRRRWFALRRVWGSTNVASPQSTVDAIARELVLEHLPFVLADVDQLPTQVGHRDLALAAVELVVDVAMAIAGQMQNRFAHRLRGNRAGVEANAAQHFPLRARRRRRGDCCFAAAMAAFWPAGPLPITIRSYCIRESYSWRSITQTAKHGVFRPVKLR